MSVCEPSNKGNIDDGACNLAFQANPSELPHRFGRVQIKQRKCNGKGDTVSVSETTKNSSHWSSSANFGAIPGKKTRQQQNVKNRPDELTPLDQQINKVDIEFTVRAPKN